MIPLPRILIYHTPCTIMVAVRTQDPFMDCHNSIAYNRQVFAWLLGSTCLLYTHEIALWLSNRGAVQ
jgi:hypothetical protein